MASFLKTQSCICVARKAGCPVWDGFDYGHVPVSHTLDFRRRFAVAADGTATWEERVK